MKLKVNGKEAYFTTSGREIDKDQPTIVFVHGCRSVYALSSDASSPAAGASPSAKQSRPAGR